MAPLWADANLHSAILIGGRTTWAFARDNGLPFSEYFSKIDQSTGMPLRATLLSACLSMMYGAIYVGSSVAFQSIVGSTIIMLFLTYGMYPFSGVVQVNWHMITLAIPQTVLAVRGRQHLPPRPFDLGKLGWYLNALAPVLVIFLTAFICLPYALPVTAQSMSKGKSTHLCLEKF